MPAEYEDENEHEHEHEHEQRGVRPGEGPVRKGAIMRVQTFLGKVSMDSLRQMDEHINHWLETHNVEPKLVLQSFGQEKHREAGSNEPVIVTSIWY